jgi:shikimate dehydrogenase
VFICGAGGAARAIGFALADAGVAHITFKNRTVARAEALAVQLNAAYPNLATVGASPGGHDVALNATPVGLEPEDPLPFAIADLSPGTLAAEVLMKPPVTALLVAAAAAGFDTHQGRHMLDRQLDLMFDFLRISSR